MDYLLLICSFFYIVAAFSAAKHLIAPNKPFKIYFVPSIAIALFGHGYWLFNNIIVIGGENLPILNVLSLVTFITSLLATIPHKRFNMGILQPIIYAFTVLNLQAVIFLPSHFITHLENHVAIAIHIVIALLAYSILSIASLFALQLAYLDYRLKCKKPPLTKMSMPPLMTLEQKLFQITLVGFVFLTGTLFTGFLFIENMFVPEQVYKVYLSFIAWVIYAILLWGHFHKGWRGRSTTYITIIGSSLLTLAYFGSRFVREVILH